MSVGEAGGGAIDGGGDVSEDYLHLQCMNRQDLCHGFVFDMYLHVYGLVLSVVHTPELPLDSHHPKSSRLLLRRGGDGKELPGDAQHGALPARAHQELSLRGELRPEGALVPAATWRLPLHRPGAGAHQGARHAATGREVTVRGASFARSIVRALARARATPDIVFNVDTALVPYVKMSYFTDVSQL